VSACTKVNCLKALTNKLLLSCEHGGNRVPPEYRYLFKNNQHILDSHRGLDIGALDVARKLARSLDTPLYYSQTSRLLVDLNRSLHHRNLFSEFTKQSGKEIRTAILDEHYHPYRTQVKLKVHDSIASGRGILHLSIHSFTPELGKQTRDADIGLLYDPARKHEKAFCRHLRTVLQKTSELRVRLNYPYRGNADGLTTSLRKSFPAAHYMGIEIEINQTLLTGELKQQKEITRLLQTGINLSLENK